MSVYTHLDQEELQEICQEFGVQMRTASPIKNGVENSNWFITATDGHEYVLTLYEERSIAEVRKLCNLLEVLDTKALPIALPVRHESDALCANYLDKALTLAPRLEGSHPHSATRQMCENMGAVLAKLHECMADLPPKDYEQERFAWERVRDEHMPHMSSDDKALMYKIWQNYENARHDHHLPDGLIHADLFLDNTLWQGEMVTGLLDFTEVGTDDLLMDVCITANDFCTDWQSLQFDDIKFLAFLRGFESVRPLFPTEKYALPAFMAMAATRFWLLRLDIAAQNAREGRGGEHVLQKSPAAMRDLARQHTGRVFNIY